MSIYQEEMMRKLPKLGCTGTMPLQFLRDKHQHLPRLHRRTRLVFPRFVLLDYASAFYSTILLKNKIIVVDAF